MIISALVSGAEQKIGEETAKACDFCEIANGEGEHILIAGNEKAVAFLSKGDGHPLIIPRRHLSSITPGDDMDRTLDLMINIYRPVKEVFRQLGVDGLRFQVNDGSIQHVPHLHIHLKPFVGELDDAVPFVVENGQRVKLAEDIKNWLDNC